MRSLFPIFLLALALALAILTSILVLHSLQAAPHLAINAANSALMNR
jgi:hypothetical protein